MSRAPPRAGRVSAMSTVARHFSPAKTPRPGTLEERPRWHPAGRIRVLVADDNADAAEGLAAFLEALGHDVRTEHNGAAALETAITWQPDAIFLDISMPILEGHEVCKRLRREEWAQGAMIAAVTGFGAAEDRERSFESGFDYHLVKPVDPRSIVKLLQYL
jgi:CheY-like chemotaxis protein